MYFLVADTVVDRDDLNLYEKMACVVLARYANHEAFDGLLSMDIIALKMGATSKQAQDAIQSLIGKGLLAQESLPSHSQATSTIQKGLENLETYRFREIEGVKDEQGTRDTQVSSDIQEKSVTSDVIQAIFDEVVPKRQALILYELAGRSLNRLKDAYAVVRTGSHFDLVDALSEYLQEGASPVKRIKIDEQPIVEEKVEVKEKVEGVDYRNNGTELTNDAISQMFEALEPAGIPVGMPTGLPAASAQEVKSQINMSRIHALYQQQQNKKK